MKQQRPKHSMFPQATLYARSHTGELKFCNPCLLQRPQGRLHSETNLLHVSRLYWCLFASTFCFCCSWFYLKAPGIYLAVDEDSCAVTTVVTRISVLQIHCRKISAQKWRRRKNYLDIDRLMDYCSWTLSRAYEHFYTRSSAGSI